MATFKYVAKDQDARNVSGKMAADVPQNCSAI